MSSITLRDGRTLGYRVHGAPEGRAVFWFPGTPSSRLFVPPDVQLLSTRSVRLVVVERPGYGCSTAQPGRTLLDWPNDVVELADALGVAQFTVAGFSGGGPYAAACAFALPNRVRRLVVIGSMAPLDSHAVRASVPLLGRLFLAILGSPTPVARTILRWTRPRPAAIQRAMLRHLAPCDQEVLAKGDVLARQIAMTEEALRPGYDAWTHEIRLVTHAWGFDLTRIAVATELLWGDQDRTTSLAMAEAYAKIPGASLQIVENAGHFIHIGHWDLVVQALAR